MEVLLDSRRYVLLPVLGSAGGCGGTKGAEPKVLVEVVLGRAPTALGLSVPVLEATGSIAPQLRQNFCSLELSVPQKGQNISDLSKFC